MLVGSIYGLSIVFEFNIVLGLIMLHRAGWAHGDVSPGNIILYNNHIKITDLEYAVPLKEDVAYKQVVRCIRASISRAIR